MNCLVCSGEVSRRGGKKYCSFRCYWSRPTTKKSVNCSCVVCGKVVTVTGYGKKTSLRKLCSLSCIGEFNRKRISGTKDASLYHEVTCKICKKQFEALKSRKKREFCSRNCRSKYAWKHLNLSKKMVSKRYEVQTKLGIIIVRSRWEAIFIKNFLEKKNLRWEYEMRTISLPDGHTYTPDFYLEDDDVFIEIKGYERGPSLENVNIARNMGYKILYLNGKTLEKVYGLDLSLKGEISSFKEVV